MPVTLPYGRERARVARLVLSLLRTVRSAYTPELTLEQASEFLFLMMHARCWGSLGFGPLGAA